MSRPNPTAESAIGGAASVAEPSAPSEELADAGDQSKELQAQPTGTLVTLNSANDILTDVEATEVDEQLLNQFLSKRPMEKFRLVVVDADLLREKIRDAAQAGALEIALFDDDPVRLIADSSEEHHAGWQSGFGTWRGKIEDDEFSTAMFIVSPDGTVDSTIRSPTAGRFKLESIGATSIHLLWKKDANLSIPIH